MMYMYPGLNSFEGENLFVQAQGFAFQQFHQQQNWNLYNQLTIDPFILETNNNILNTFIPTDQDFVQQNLGFNGFNVKNGSNHIYSKYTIPSITSIISQHVTTNNFNAMNFLPLSNTNNMITPIISSIPTKPSIGIDFNYNENINLLTHSQSQSQPQLQPQLQSQSQSNSIQSSDTLSFFTIPDKDTTISLQDILDGTKLMQDISNDLTSYNSNSLQDITNNLITDLIDENSIDWLIQDDWKETSKLDETYESKGKSSEKKQDEIFCQDIVDDLIEEHMKEIKKVVHNEILYQEILTDSSSLEYQDFKTMIQIDDNNLSSITTKTTTSITTIQSQDIIIKQEEIGQGISQEFITESSLSSNNMFIPQEIDISHGMLPNSTNLVTNQRTFKCKEIGCSKEYNCYAKMKSHKITHTNDKPFTCNVLGCNKKFKRSGELLKHQLNHLN